MQLESISLQVMYVMWCRLDLGAFFEGQRCSKSGFEVPLRPWDAWRCLKMSEILFCFDMSHVLILRLHAKEVSHLRRGILEPQIRSEICFRITLAGQDWSCGHKRGIHVSLLDHQCGELLHEVLHCEPQKPHGGNENELTEHSPQEHIPKFVDISTILRIVDMWRRLSLWAISKEAALLQLCDGRNKWSQQTVGKQEEVSLGPWRSSTGSELGCKATKDCRRGRPLLPGSKFESRANMHNYVVWLIMIGFLPSLGLVKQHKR